MSELQTTIRPPVEANKASFFDVVKQSQKSWRNLKRGVVSRPQEIPSLSSVLDNSIKRTFPKYIDVDRPPTIVAWSVLRDEPLEAEGFQFEYRRPEGISQSDENAYYTGIDQLNEWGTDFAAKSWLSHSPKSFLFQKMGEIYSDICINLGQKIAYKQAYRLMGDVQKSARSNGQGFEDAVLEALFRHNFGQINTIIAQAGIKGCETLDELALKLGKSLPEKDLINVLSGLYPEGNDSVLKRLSKRVALSIITGGRHSQLGVAEIVVAHPAAAFIAGTGAATAIDLMTGVATGALSGSIATALWCYAIIHETTHDYQTDTRFKGFIPLTLVSTGKRPEPEFSTSGVS